jgi:IMP dehydrogenase
MISFESVTIVTRVISKIPHRAQCKPMVAFCGTSLEIPMIASPMPDVCNSEMARTLAILGGMGIIHRFQTIEQQVSEYKVATGIRSTSALTPLQMSRIACAIGATDDYDRRFIELAKEGCRIFCIDTANGANTQVKAAIDTIRLAWTTFPESKNEQIYIIAGNVATHEGFSFLDECGVDAIRVGIAGGSVCETKTETGIHIPTLHSVVECKWAISDRKALIIADGGIKIPGDMCKALVGGADVVMCGGIFAGTKESPGDTLKIDQKHYKLYRGAASYSVQQISRKSPSYNEGNETLVPYKGRVEKVTTRFKEGLQSSMSYANARDLLEYRQNAKIVPL